MASLFIFMIIIYLVEAGHVEVIDLENNEGYVPIKIGDIRLIDHTIKILHIINITEIEIARNQIEDNIKLLNRTLPSDSINDNIHMTIVRSFIELDTKLRALTPKTRYKRGLIDLLGKTLKVIAGTMDSDDEKDIYNSLHNLDIDSAQLIDQNNKQVKINKELQNQVKMLNKNIVNMEKYISSQIKYIVLNTQIRDNYYYLKICFQIHNDINSLLHFIDTIEDVILTSRLGILTRNILTDQETDLIGSDEEFANIELVSLLYKHNIIIFTLLIPKFDENLYEKYNIEEVLNKKNETIVLSTNEILFKNNEIYMSNVKNNKTKNLIIIQDKCIQDIFKNKNINNCIKINKTPKENIKSITEGSVIIKNLKITDMKTSCNNNMQISGTKIITFKNCTIIINNEIFENKKEIVQYHYINPVLIKTVNYSKDPIHELTLEKIDTKSIENRNLIKKSDKRIETHFILQYCIIITIIIIIIVLSIKCYKQMFRNKNISNAPRTEALTNDGGVTIPQPVISIF